MVAVCSGGFIDPVYVADSRFHPGCVLVLWVALNGGTPTGILSGSLPGVDPLVSFVALMLASVFFVIGIFLAIRFIHNRPFRSLITPTRSIAWGRLFQGFGAWFVLAGLTSVLEALLYPGRYAWTFNPKQFIPFVFLALILIPSRLRERSFSFGLTFCRDLGFVSGTSGIEFDFRFLFMLPHFGNPEASVNYP